MRLGDESRVKSRQTATIEISPERSGPGEAPEFIVNNQASSSLKTPMGHIPGELAWACGSWGSQPTETGPLRNPDGTGR